jgi:CRISPR system Cascade subunit CasE
MKISLLKMNPWHPDVIRDIDDIYEMHRTLMSGFPSDDPGIVLFRQESEAGSLKPIIIVLSEKDPDWSHLVETTQLIGDPRTKEFSPVIGDGDTFRFKLLAHPSFASKEGLEDPLAPGRKRFIKGEDDRALWLQRQAERRGFEILQVVETERKVIRGRKGKDRISLPCIMFEGFLRATDADMMEQSIGRNIGQKRFAGCGLLSLQRV